MLKNFRLIAAQSSPVSPLGQLDYQEGWWVGGWGPRYLASKRERGSARIPRLLGEDINLSGIR